MLRHRRFIAALTVVTLSIFPRITVHAEDQGQAVLVAPVEIKAVKAQLPIFGNLVPYRESNLSVKVPGYVEEMLVDIGDPVEKGRPLLTLDAVQAQLNVRQLQASLNEARIRLEEANRLAAEGEQLRKDHNISNSEFLTRMTERQAGRSQVEQIKAQLDLAQEALSRHTLTAPFSGVITAKLTEVGEAVGTETEVLTLTQLDPVYLQIQVPSRYYGSLTTDTQVLVDSGNEQEAALTTTIDRIVPQADPALRSFLVRLRLDNTEQRWLPGMNVRARFLIDNNQDQDALFLPKDALVRKPDGRVLVFKVVENGQANIARAVQVKPGILQDKGISVTSEQLNAGDRVVIYGNESLADGDTIIPKLTRSAKGKVR
ncbi:efflux RND transporter periplasmic adaptor subunit [Thalassotalea mangrovi]|uniref:Efflux RND transporter periplasmic adaptor subunit n=1 Tax=Thalassotalea mangrovi TaxID=2572245 RepID=A0A4U1B1V8_9GAMM|nr:efflux RND transporter periplasmic adaptor subunit [Thalassotalea mangrovi]TKB43250.1 efflux RND transporter periplasmic adaptor subunit [Thalassotalea mangrovi]